MHVHARAVGAVLCAVALAGCLGGAELGRVSVRITAEPDPERQSLVLVIGSIEVRRAGQVPHSEDPPMAPESRVRTSDTAGIGWVTLSEQPRRIDMRPGDRAGHALGADVLAAGAFDRVRLRILDGHVVNGTGGEEPLYAPTGAVRANGSFTLAAGGAADVTLHVAVENHTVDSPTRRTVLVPVVADVDVATYRPARG